MKIGIDIGSTSLKGVILNENNDIIFRKYSRHHAAIIPALLDFLDEARTLVGDEVVQIMFTGSIGMGISERMQLSFNQEVVSSIRYVQTMHPEVKTFIDVGGEDSKMIFFNPNRQPDIRMNGSCAGGTGAFIDQMASLLGIPLEEMNIFAEKSEIIYPIASRCGVFSKTDIQNLVANNVEKSAIVASIFHAVALQVISSLSRGYEVVPKLFFCGAPFAYLPELKKAFLKLLQYADSEVIDCDYPELVPAYGTALSITKKEKEFTLSKIIEKVEKLHQENISLTSTLSPLFSTKTEFEERVKQQSTHYIPKVSNFDENESLFLGVDSGSTTTKIVITNSKDEIVYEYYAKNIGDSIGSFIKGMTLFKEQFSDRKIEFASSAVTGYGENLLKTAFDLHFGIVETMAHFLAARHLVPDVSFILDIGGQDMKAIFVENGNIKNIEINEACSSGCGSFIDGFANMLNMSVGDFALMACKAQEPCDLGTRCTVFMNSKVKQSLREGSSVENVAAGLSYSVIKNCLFKVLKLKSSDELGAQIMVQGGTFKNLSVLRSLELLTGKSVSISNIPELMGAYGAALHARAEWQKNKQREEPLKTICLDESLQIKAFKSSYLRCNGCENQCNIKKITFSNQKQFYSGNKCEKIFSNIDKNIEKGDNFHAIKYKMLFGRKEELTKPLFTMGIPRGLVFYEDYPFWHTLFSGCNIQPLLSGVTTVAQYEKGIKTIMADNICFPAKLMHGHVMCLLKKNVDRILYPYIVYEKKENPNAINSYHCPIVTGYSDVLISSIESQELYNVPIDAPVLNFNEPSLFSASLCDYLIPLGVSKSVIQKALRKAIKTQLDFEKSLKKMVTSLYDKAIKEGRRVIVLAGRPYHIDPLIQHKISEAITDFGVTVINEDIVRWIESDFFQKTDSVAQWAFPNRLLTCAKWVAAQPASVMFVQITSFGCGPDAFINEEVKQLLQAKGKTYTLLKVDDVNNIGSLKLRIRSLLESSKMETEITPIPLKRTPVFEKKDRIRTIIAPYFAENYSEILPPLFKLMDINLVVLPPSDSASNDMGLQFANNEICYPATLVIGDIMKALQSGKYHPNEVAVAITQTGGQCRASNYISLIKKAILAGGFDSVPVVSVSFGSGLLNEQPGFKLKWEKSAIPALYALLFVDSLLKLYYPAVVRETTVGEAKRIKDLYIGKAISLIKNRKHKDLISLLSKASDDFLSIIDSKIKAPIIGVVGEIYVKYNSFSHKNILNWLIEQGVEIVPASLYNFFICEFVNLQIKKELHIKKVKIPLLFSNYLFKKITQIAQKFDQAAQKFPFYRPFADLEKDAENASKIINLAAQFGEGWLIPGEIAAFAENNIHNAISLQPFGCIANHVISKGIEKRIKKNYPKMNLLFLDFDGGTSEANVMNRLHFMIDNAKKAF